MYMVLLFSFFPESFDHVVSEKNRAGKIDCEIVGMR